MDVPPDVAEVLAEFGSAVRPIAGVVALYVGGSLATKDYRAGVSDLDLVALVDGPLNDQQRQQLRDLHRTLIAEYRAADKLHCVYVPIGELADVTAAHVTWAAKMLFQRSCTGIARAELLRHGFAVFGPPISATIPPVSSAELREAVRRDLRNYWIPALRRPSIWFQDSYIDLSLFTVARAEVTLLEDRLPTKSEALQRFERFAVPAALIDQVRRRRDRQPTTISFIGRIRRAGVVRRLVAERIQYLLALTSD
ncbi:nucleotidyltransferase domain-containing protein [Nocardia sp. NPDC049149]|uniref:nucleotidyltransferase domain-containing protein n=1 Tax=Nocardia sp. NPDC049149 TaxID=3364315 RepID=UPI0037153419